MATKHEVERLAIVETKVENLKAQNETDHKTMLDTMGVGFEKMTEFIDSADTKYVSKVEAQKIEVRIKALWAVVGTIILSAVTFLLWVSQEFMKHVTK